MIVSLARFNRGMALRPVHRIKHVVDFSGTLSLNTILPVNLIEAKDAPVLANTAEVETGSKVNGIYLKVLIASNDVEVIGAIPNVYMAIFKNPASALANPDPISIGDEDVKRFIIHQEMSMVENRRSGIPTVLFNGVIKIPKGYIRNGPDDALRILIKSPQIDISVCFQCHYKEFR